MCAVVVPRRRLSYTRIVAFATKRGGSRIPPKFNSHHPPWRTLPAHFFSREECRYGASRRRFCTTNPPAFSPLKGGKLLRKIGKKSTCNTTYSTPNRHEGGAFHMRDPRETAQLIHYPHIYDDFMSKIWQLMTILSQFFLLIINVLIDYVVFFPMTFWEKI